MLTRIHACANDLFDLHFMHDRGTLTPRIPWPGSRKLEADASICRDYGEIRCLHVAESERLLPNGAQVTYAFQLFKLTFKLMSPQIVLVEDVNVIRDRWEIK